MQANWSQSKAPALNTISSNQISALNASSIATSLKSTSTTASATTAAAEIPASSLRLKEREGLSDENMPVLQNIVSTVNLKCQLDLRKIALHARNAEYNPKRFAAVIMRIRNPKTTALIFSSGKMVCTGAKSEELSRLASKKYAKTVKKIGFPVSFTEFKVQNIVGSCDVGFAIRLENLSNSHDSFCSYEPEIFPGLIYRMIKPKVVILVFVSGKIVLTGAKYREDIYKAYENIYPVLKEHKKKPREEFDPSGIKHATR